MLTKRSARSRLGSSRLAPSPLLAPPDEPKEAKSPRRRRARRAKGSEEPKYPITEEPKEAKSPRRRRARRAQGGEEPAETERPHARLDSPKVTFGAANLCNPSLRSTYSSRKAAMSN